MPFRRVGFGLFNVTLKRRPAGKSVSRLASLTIIGVDHGRLKEEMKILAVVNCLQLMQSGEAGLQHQGEGVGQVSAAGFGASSSPISDVAFPSGEKRRCTPEKKSVCNRKTASLNIAMVSASSTSSGRSGTSTPG